LTKGDEFFGEFEVINSRRNVVHSTPSVYEAKYVVYASRERVAEVPVPLSNDIIIATVRAYEKHLDELMTLIAGRYSTAFPEGRNAAVTATECLRLIDVVRF
jgi:hypothetical protein